MTDSTRMPTQSDIEKHLKAFQVQPVDWQKKFEEADHKTLESINKCLTYKKPEHERRDNILGAMVTAFWRALAFSGIAAFILIFAGVLQAPPGVTGENGTPANCWPILVAILGTVFGAAGLILDKDARRNRRRIAVTPKAHLHVPQAVTYSAKLESSVKHAGGQVVVTCSSADGGTSEVIRMPLPVCDIAQIAEVMETLNGVLATKQIEDNVVRTQMLAERDIDETDKNKTLHALIEQGRIIQEQNFINKKAFDSLNKELQTQVRDKAQQLLQEQTQTAS